MLRRIRVTGHSMHPTLAHDATAWVESLTYRLRTPRRGDLVVACAPDADRRVIKRITAIPGDDVDGHRIPAGFYWLDGDNPALSTDSATHGPVERSLIVGRVVGRAARR